MSREHEIKSGLPDENSTAWRDRAAMVEAFGPALVAECERSLDQAAWVPRQSPGRQMNLHQQERVIWDWLYALSWGETMGQCVPQADGTWLARPFPFKMDKAFPTLPEAMAYVERHGCR